MEAFRREVKYVGTPSVPEAPQPHDLHGLGDDVYGGDADPAILKDQTVASGAGAHIQDAAAAQVQGDILQRREFRGLTEEDTDGDGLLLAIVTVNDDRGRFLPVEEVEQR
jgi:hypothetical protein